MIAPNSEQKRLLEEQRQEALRRRAEEEKGEADEVVPESGQKGPVVPRASNLLGTWNTEKEKEHERMEAGKDETIIEEQEVAEDVLALVQEFNRAMNKPVGYQPTPEELDDYLELRETLAPVVEEEPKGAKQDDSLRAQIEKLLLSGMSRWDIEKKYPQYNKKTVQVVTWNLENAGKIPHRTKGTEVAITEKGTAVSKKDKDETMIQTFAKGSPPEALINSMKLPAFNDPLSFESGMHFGLSSIVLAIKLVQEMATAGIQQAKPLIEMARDMRGGELAAAKQAADSASEETAHRVVGEFAPYLESLQQALAENKKEAAVVGDPMRNMLVSSFKPVLDNVMQQLMHSFMPGMGTPAQNASGTQSSAPQISTPVGWKISTRKEVSAGENPSAKEGEK